MTDFEQDLKSTEDSMRRLMKIFGITLFILLFGVGGWAIASKVESAVVATGNFIVKSNGQEVQHLQGGVVGEILVKEGDRVKKGQVVVRLDAAQVHAQLGIVKRELIELTAERARLLAERDNRATILRPKSLKTGGTSSALTKALALQQTLLNERSSAMHSQLSQLTEQKNQVESGLRGLRGLKLARLGELAQVNGDLKAFIRLDKKRLIRRSTLRQTRRQASRLQGDLMDIQSRFATKKSKLSEIEFRIREITRKARSEILNRLQVVRASIGTALEKYQASKDRMKRLDIRAPSSGIVHELKAHTVGGVIPPGKSVMTIIPHDVPLVVLAQIKTNEVDQVKVGQKAMVRISAFSRQASPELDGEVTNVSADRSVDERTGLAFFTVRIAIAPNQQAKLDGKKLTAGLPADVFIKGKPRRVINYLTQPLRDQMGLAFRED